MFPCAVFRGSPPGTFAASAGVREETGSSLSSSFWWETLLEKPLGIPESLGFTDGALELRLISVLHYLPMFVCLIVCVCVYVLGC